MDIIVFYTDFQLCACVTSKLNSRHTTTSWAFGDFCDSTQVSSRLFLLFFFLGFDFSGLCRLPLVCLLGRCSEFGCSSVLFHSDYPCMPAC